MTNKQNTCCFTGHRPGKLSFGYDETHPDCLRLKVALIGAVDRMRDRGVTTFYSGMAQGVDMMAAEIVLDIKRAYLDSRMRLVAVLPYEGQANRWTEKYRERYFTILSKADEVITLQKRYTDTCLLERNRYMVDRSAYLIAVYNGAGGGTGYTVDYAKKQGLDVTLINPDALREEPITSSIPLLPLSGGFGHKEKP